MTNETLFFSYSRDDSEFVLKLAHQLRNAGASIWLDQLDIAPGNHWDSTIEEALQRSGYLLVFLSKTSVDSNNVMDEVSFAVEEQKTVVPIIIEPCEIPFRLRRLQHADFTDNYQTGIEQLIGALNLEESVMAKLTKKEQAPLAQKVEEVQVKEPAMAFSSESNGGSSVPPPPSAPAMGNSRPKKSKGWVLPFVLLIAMLGAGALTYLCIIPDYLGLNEMMGQVCECCAQDDITAIELCEDTGSVECYTAMIRGSSSSDTDVANAQKALKKMLDKAGFIQYSESDGSARYFDQLRGEKSKEPAAGDWLIATTARNVRDGVIGVDEVAERNGDVIDEDQVVFVEESIMSGTAIWIKIQYTE
jgi:hypothetical protein